MSIPVIDIAGYLDGSDKMGVAAKIGEACQDIGFFMIRGHGERPIVFYYLFDADEGYLTAL